MHTRPGSRAEHRTPGVLPFALFLLGQAVLPTCAFVVNAPRSEVGILLALIALLAVALLIVGVRTGWRARTLALSALGLLALAAIGGYLISMTVQTSVLATGGVHGYARSSSTGVRVDRSATSNRSSTG